MPRLTPVSWKDLVKRLRELGFEGPYAGGKHPQMLRDDLTVIIPNPHDGDIGMGLLSRLLRQAGISREEWLGQVENEDEPSQITYDRNLIFLDSNCWQPHNSR